MYKNQKQIETRYHSVWIGPSAKLSSIRPWVLLNLFTFQMHDSLGLKLSHELPNQVVYPRGREHWLPERLHLRIDFEARSLITETGTQRCRALAAAW